MNTITWVSVLILLLGLSFSHTIKTKLRLYLWRRLLQLKRHETIFSKLYTNVNGFEVSQEGRKKNNCIELTYGEIQFESFIALLSCCHVNTNTVFCDLGSGSGKAVIAAAMVFPLQHAIGIEVLPNLHACALSQVQRLSNDPFYTTKTKKIQFYNIDLLNFDLQSTTLIFINATAFFGKYWNKICAHLQKMRPRTRCICISKQLSKNHFILEHSTKVEMSWGISHAYIYRRR